jgi:hypothetical protein
VMHWPGSLTVAGVAVGVIALAAGCGGSASSDDEQPATQASITGVERVFITRPLGQSLIAVLIHVEFDPSVPPAVIYRALGDDGKDYSGVFPGDSKICGFPGYLGLGPNAGREDNKRTIAFIVPQSVELAELSWSLSAEKRAHSVSLPAEIVVCTPPIGS